MSKLNVKIDYRVAATILMGLRSGLVQLLKYVDKLTDMLDQAARDSNV